MDMNLFRMYQKGLKKTTNMVGEAVEAPSKHYYFEPSDKKVGPDEEGVYYTVYSASLDANGREQKTVYKKDMKVSNYEEIQRFVRGLNFQSLRKGQPIKEEKTLNEEPFLGRGMSKAARAADVDQSDREYIETRQKRRKAYDAGTAAHKDGKPESHNPYHPTQGKKVNEASNESGYYKVCYTDTSGVKRDIRVQAQDENGAKKAVANNAASVQSVTFLGPENTYESVSDKTPTKPAVDPKKSEAEKERAWRMWKDGRGPRPKV